MSQFQTNSREVVNASKLVTHVTIIGRLVPETSSDFMKLAKPCEWAYFSTITLELLEGHGGVRMNRSVVLRYARRHSLVLPKMTRKATWRLMIQVMPKKVARVARFAQNKFRGLRVSCYSGSSVYQPAWYELLDERC